MSFISCITHGLGWFSPLPRMVRLCVFKFGILPFSTCYERFILDRWQNHFSGHGYCGYTGNFDVVRARHSVEALLELGGKRYQFTPRDGEAKLQVIQLTAASLKEKIESLGGSWKKNNTEIIISQPTQITSEWNAFYEVLKKIFPNQGEGGLITSVHADQIPFFEEAKRTECILFSRLGKSFVMNKFEIGYFLGKGLDVCVYDTRGVLNSEGYPTEAGLYNDIESVYDFLIKSYDPSKICIYGSCGESFSAMHLFAKYHSKGINLILDNAPGSLAQVMARVNWIAAWLFDFAADYIKAPVTSKCHETREDGFNSLKKINELSENKQAGYVILSKTVGDELVPPTEVDRMATLLKSKGNIVSVLENDAKDSLARKNLGDPHLANPLRNPHLQSDFIKALFAPKSLQNL